jgi:hypothetical protein
MRKLSFLALLFLLSAAPIGDGAPIAGVFAKEVEIGPEPWKQVKRFRGGERAAVLVAGKGKMPPPVHVAVYDDNGKIVAEEKGRAPSGFMVAVAWYPARDADYRIEIRTLDSRENKCYVTIK